MEWSDEKERGRKKRAVEREEARGTKGRGMKMGDESDERIG
jgi:hypothetical protein